MDREQKNKEEEKTGAKQSYQGHVPSVMKTSRPYLLMASILPIASLGSKS
jgi:hypothetical protein